jgi:1-aminocyclopropane-1-carboxylate deaminase
LWTDAPAGIAYGLLPRAFTSSSARVQLARMTSELIGGKPVAADDIVLNEDYAYPVYGVPSKETVAAIRLSARLEGMITDPVYEGKSMQGMIDLVQKGFSPKGPKCFTPTWVAVPH